MIRRLIILLLIVGCVYRDGTTFDRNGQKIQERNYKDGELELEGKCISYYENGQIESEEYYKNGKEDGKWTYYNEDGSIDKVEEYKDGELVE